MNYSTVPRSGRDSLETTMPRRLVLTIRKHWRDLLCLALLLVVWIAVWVSRLQGPIDLRWDASTYYVLGTSLAEGKGYRLLNEPGEIAAVQYPPLLPMIIAAHERILGTNDFFKVGSALRFTYFVLSGLYLLAVYALARRLLLPLYALLVGAITALSFYSFLHPSDTLYAEIPFAFVSMLFLLCQRNGDRPLNAIASGFLSAFAYLLRTVGLALLFVWIAESLLRRRFRQAIIRTVVSAIPILIWQIHVWRVTDSEEYLHPAYAYQRASYYYSNVTYAENSKLIDPFQPELGYITAGKIARRMVRNATAVPLRLGESALVDARFGIPGHYRKSSFLLDICLVLTGLAAIAGAALVAMSSSWFLSLYFALMIGMVILTPWQSQFWRYFAPLTPLTLTFCIFFLLKIRQWLSQQSEKWGRVAGALATAPVMVGMLVVQLIVAIYFLRTMPLTSYYDKEGREKSFRHLTYESAWHSTDRAFEWIRRHGANDSIVATAVPHVAYIRTGHKAVLPPFELDPATASRLLDQVPVTYLVLDDLREPHISERYAAPVIELAPSDWQLVFQDTDGRTRIYERSR